MSIESEIQKTCLAARTCSYGLALISEKEKNFALQKMAEYLQKNKAAIITVNCQEVEEAKQDGADSAFLDRLTLNSARFDAMISAIKEIQNRPDPVGKLLASWKVPSGLDIARITIPLGVIAVIYEARPNVTVDAAILGLKSGNALILRGGSECVKTNRALCQALQEALVDAKIDPAAIQYIPNQAREALEILLQQEKFIDVVIPRGGKSLVEFIAKKSAIPTFKHLEGICHTYIHEAADLTMARDLIVNAKLRRPGICGATETLLIDRSIAREFLPTLLQALISQNCEIRGDELCQSIDTRVIPAQKEDWTTEYLAPILSVKCVADLDEAIQHINNYGSSHTDAIITENNSAAERFLKEVLSANVMHNCSTQFADGGEFGMGAEIGIATGKLHARGPVGLEQLTTFKYIVRGKGQTRP